jgi:hypothetical protein
VILLLKKTRGRRSERKREEGFALKETATLQVKMHHFPGTSDDE